MMTFPSKLRLSISAWYDRTRNPSTESRIVSSMDYAEVCVKDWGECAT
jgi:hypothetical protein